MLKKLKELLALSEKPLQALHHDKEGRELPDPTPVAPPVGYVKQKSMTEIIREQVRSHHLQAAAEAQGLETFEEAEDFDIGDDLDPSTPYEAVFDPPPQPAAPPAGPPAAAPAATNPPTAGQPTPAAAPPPGSPSAT